MALHPGKNINNIIESIIFAADHPVKPDFIVSILKPDEKNESEKKGEGIGLKKAAVIKILQELTEKYADDKYPFEIREIAEGYQFFTKKSYFPFVKKATLQKNKKRLSRAAIETLSIIAYRQPVTKSEVEFIRGVSCDYAIQKLLEKQLLSILGRSDAPGRPLLYGCSPYFMQYFGLKDMSGLPKLKEFEELEEEHLELFRQHQLDQKQESNEQAEAESAELKEAASESAEGEQETDSQAGEQTLLEGNDGEEEETSTEA